MTSRRDYDAIADAINTTPMSQRARDEIIDRLVLYFESTNPRFDPLRFRDACGASA